MDALKLIALDEEDLKIVSAHAQDAVMKVADLEFLAHRKRFVVAMNRFAWEESGGLFSHHNERRRCILHFDRVLAVRTSGIARDKPDEVLSLLAVRFDPAEAPAGVVELVFSGSGAIRLDVECIEARLTDIGGAWEASSRPAHKT
ncbi:DUF2948 family protein [Mesorhizobium sp. L-8-3]|uniref:DUF2948 family protein n=1 Tax=Mesorhizobium sp. L-8-3 TaxID=2744522 RepID=UPI001928D97E|nr:DUF2948 family protein [Mesorhizobium sp. L-8-3]BCH26723.1 hypothetical protein MesoLjLb_65080 [Mesorhizobium sp. L-8-3]